MTQRTLPLLQHAQTERLRRDHSEGVAANKALRSQLEAARAAAETLRARLEDRTKARDASAALAHNLQDVTQALQAKLAAAEATAAEVPGLRAQVGRAPVGGEQQQIIFSPPLSGGPPSGGRGVPRGAAGGAPHGA